MELRIYGYFFNNELHEFDELIWCFAQITLILAHFRSLKLLTFGKTQVNLVFRSLNRNFSSLRSLKLGCISAIKIKKTVFYFVLLSICTNFAGK